MQQQPVAKRPAVSNNNYGNLLSQQSNVIMNQSQVPKVSCFSSKINNNNLIQQSNNTLTSLMHENNLEMGIKEVITNNVDTITTHNLFNNNSFNALTNFDRKNCSSLQQHEMHLLAMKQQQKNKLQPKQLFQQHLQNEVKQEYPQSITLAQIQAQVQQQQHVQRLQAFREAQFLQQRQLQQVNFFKE